MKRTDALYQRYLDVLKEELVPVFRSSHHKLSEVLILFIITMCRFYRLFFVFSIFFIFILCYNLYGEYGECIWRWSSWPIS